MKLRTGRLASWALLAILLARTAAAQETATISGRVTDALTGQPIEGVILEFTSVANGIVVSRSTAADGRYAATVAAGAFYLRTYNPAGKHVNQTYGGVSCPTYCYHPGRSFTVAAGEIRALDLALQPSAVLEGLLVDAVTGAALTGSVTVYDAAHRYVAGANTDGFGSPATGRFRIEGSLPAGTYYLVTGGMTGGGYQQVMYDGVACAPTCRLNDATPVKAIAGQTTAGIVIRVPRASQQPTISGRVTDAVTGAPLANVIVYAADADSLQVRTFTTSDAAGNYSVVTYPGPRVLYATPAAGGYLSAVYADPWLPCNQNGCFEELRGGTVVNVTGAVGGVDFRLRRPGSIAGRVAGPPPANGSRVVSLYRESGAAAGATTVLPDGTYRIDVAPGRYVARLDSQLYDGLPCPAGACAVTTGTRITVAEGAVTGDIDFAVPAPGGLGGTITYAGTPPPYATVEVLSGDAYVTGSSTMSGSYSFAELVPGTYRVRVTAPGYVTQWFGGGCDACGERGSAVTVPSAGTATANFAMAPAAVVTGSVTPGDGITIEAVRADGAVVAEAYATGGQFTLSTLPSGVFYFRAVDRIKYSYRYGPYGGDYPPQWFDGVPCDAPGCVLDGATPVTITAGQATPGINFTLDRPLTISGRVRAEGDILDYDRGVLQYVAVHAYTAAGRRVGTSFPGFGGYSIKGLRPGRYYLRTEGAAANGYADQIYKDLPCAGCQPADGTPVVLGADASRRDIDFVLQPAGSIAGTVRTAGSTDPIGGVTISVYSDAGRLVGSTTSASTGVYLVRGLAPGRYFVATSNQRGYADVVYPSVACGACDPTRGAPVDVAAAASTAGIDFALAPGALISGTVKDASGSGARGATVSFFSGSGAVVARATSNDGGVYAASVPAGTTYARLDGALLGRDPSVPVPFFPGPTIPRVDAARLATMLYDAIPCPSGMCDPAAGTPIAATAGAVVRDIDFSSPVCAARRLMPGLLPGATVDTAYAAQFAIDPASPVRYSISHGTLPPGLILDAETGALTGTPTARGEYPFTVRAVDGAGCPTGREYRLEVASCAAVIAGSSVFDVPGAGGAIAVSVGGSCAVSPLPSVPWITAVPSPDRTVLQFAVSPNPGGRRSGTITIGTRAAIVNQGTTRVAAPFGVVDLPGDGSVVSGSVALGGWALDDLRVTRVTIHRAPVDGEGAAAIYIGDAVLVPGARPDVELAYQEMPYANRAGWGYLLLTNMLPGQGNGIFTLFFTAYDIEGNAVSLGTRTLVGANRTATKPFGAIDTPGQGETIGGAGYVNYGWALTPQPKAIPPDGSTLRVLLDGVDAGPVSYGHFRPDVSGLFPGLKNSAGPVGFRTIDTTALADGLHTIAWIVTDDAGAAEGIGSRYFTVANDPGSQGSVTLAPPAQAAASAGPMQIGVKPLERITFTLDAGGCAAAFEGFEDVQGRHRPLPVGSSLDAATGAFTWQPGPGFVGTYHLGFTIRDCSGQTRRVDVEVTIGGQHQ